jgi:2-methylcitrate dehydratase PrpD
MNRLCALQSGDPLGPVRINFSMPHSLAVAMVAGRLTPGDLSEEELQANRQVIESLADKIEVVHDWSITLRMLERMAEHIPLTDLLSEVDFKRFFTLGSDMGRQVGGILELSPKDLFQIGGFLFTRAPRLFLAATGIATERNGKAKEKFGLARARLDQLPMPFSASVTMRLHGNEEISRDIEVPRGAAGRDPDETTGLVRRKFRDQATPLLSEEKVEQALQLIDQLEELDNISELTSVLCIS